MEQTNYFGQPFKFISYSILKGKDGFYANIYFTDYAIWNSPSSCTLMLPFDGWNCD